MPYPARWGKISGNEIIRSEQEAASMPCGKGAARLLHIPCRTRVKSGIRPGKGSDVH